MPLNERGRNFSETFEKQHQNSKESQANGDGRRALGRRGRGPFKIIMNLFKLLYGAATKKQFTIATGVALRGEPTWPCVVADNLGQVGTPNPKQGSELGEAATDPERTRH